MHHTILSAVMLVIIGLLSIIPTARVHAAALETCEVFNNQYTITISSPENQTVNSSDAPTFSLDISAQSLSLDTDIMAGFYRQNDDQTYTLAAWVPVVENFVISPEPQEAVVSLPQALPAGNYRLVIYANPNAEQAKSLFYGDLRGEANLDFTVVNDIERPFLEVVSINGEAETGEPVAAVEEVRYVVSVSNPFGDKAIRGGLLMYGFRGMTPDQTKIQSTQNYEIKLVPGATNQYELLVESLEVASYLVQAVYLAEDGVQYVVSTPVSVAGFPEESPSAKFTSLSVVERDGAKHVVACLNLPMTGGNLFGDMTDDFVVSMKLLDAASGERVGNVEVMETLDITTVAGKSVSVPLPEGIDGFTAEATIAQNGAITHQLKSDVDCTMGSVGCVSGSTYEEIAPNVDAIKVVVIAIVTAVIALLLGAYVAHKRRPKVANTQLPDNDSEI